MLTVEAASRARDLKLPSARLEAGLDNTSTSFYGCSLRSSLERFFSQARPSIIYTKNYFNVAGTLTILLTFIDRTSFLDSTKKL